MKKFSETILLRKTHLEPFFTCTKKLTITPFYDFELSNLSLLNKFYKNFRSVLAENFEPDPFLCFI